MKKVIKITLVLSLAFWSVNSYAQQRGNAQNNLKAMMERMDQHLELSDDQSEQVIAALKEWRLGMKELRSERETLDAETLKQKRRALRKQRTQALTEILNEDQIAKFKENIDEIFPSRQRKTTGNK